MCSEASFLNSGFSIYAKELLTRLYNTNKYDIAEFASYANVNDPRDSKIPWTIYANAVQKTDPRYNEYSSRSDNMFGRWRFDKVVIDFKPDVVIDIRDYWMSSYQELSPARKFFHWILMPTVDSAPQQQSWISTFLDADAIFTYSDWGAKTLEKQSSGQINYVDTACPRRLRLGRRTSRPWPRRRPWRSAGARTRWRRRGSSARRARTRRAASRP